MSKTILVTGATGRQGGGLIKALVASEAASTFKIFGLTRNPQSPAAIRLQEQGVTLVQGDFNNVPAIFRHPELAKQPLWGVFCVQSPGIRVSGAKAETEQGKAFIDQAVANNVQFFVYASVDRGGSNSEGTPTPVAQFSSKNDIEQHLMKKAGAMKWVILRPTTFMENLSTDVQGTTWASAYKYIMKSKPMHLISTSDIGKVAAKVVMDAENYANTSIALAADKLTFAEADAIFKDKTGKPIPVLPVLPFKAVMLGLRQVKIMFEWFPADSPGIDTAECKEKWGLMTWGEWVETKSAFRKGA